MKTLLISLLVLYALQLSAQNPIVPPGVYIADPAAHVWQDGKLYIYGSLDESTDYYCSWRYHVLVTEDMQTWRIHENRFASKGDGDQVPYNNSLLFAPDVMFRDGLYYLYYCQPDPHNAEGVAVSDSPLGPFVNGRPIDTHGHNQIDPNVFIDDDGQAYYAWGQFTMKMAKLKPNMVELEESTVLDSVLTEREHFFHEGPFMTKRNGIYYLVYADMSRSGMPTSIGYATSHSPMGPYTYGGVIVDNDRCDLGNWNNHGSIAEFNGQWYVLYHRATHNSKMMRKACIEPITSRPDGGIPEVEMTSQGAGGPLSAFAEIDAARACTLLGNVRIELIEPGNEALTKIQHENRAVFKYIDFGNGADSVSMRFKSGTAPGMITIKADMPWGPTIADVTIPESGAANEWMILSAETEDIKGVHAMHLMFFTAEGRPIWDVALDWIKFSK